MADMVNIGKFITDNKWQEVTDPKMFNSDPKTKEPIPTPNGLFSYEIFGPKHTKLRDTKWGYINLGSEIIHPVALGLMDRISGAFRKMILRKVKYTVDKDGLLVPDPDNGKWGLAYIKEIIDKIDWTKLSNYDNKKAYIVKLKQAHKSKIMYIDKWIIEPAGLRDFSIVNGRVKYDEVNDLYRNLIATVKEGLNNNTANYLLGNQDKEQSVSKETIIQKQVDDLHQYFFGRLSGKSGLIRGAQIKKRTDFAARLVASALPEIPPLSATIPWGTLLNLFAPFVIHYVEKDSTLKKQLTGSADYVSIEDYANIFQYIAKNMGVVTKEKPQLKNKLIEILKEVIEKNDLKVDIKRDPAFGDVSHWVCYPIIDTRDVYNIGMNSLYYSPIGGDSMNTRTVLYYNNTLALRGNKIKFENDVWGRYCSLDTHYNKFFKNKNH